MFLGEYSYTLDDKGRITLPAKFRDQLAQGVVITRGLDRCLFVFKFEDWKRFTSEMPGRLPITQKSARDFSRFFFSGAVDVIPDKQGRVLIPPFLREYADLRDEAMVIGVNTRLELWAPEQWREALMDVESNAEMIAEQFGNITI
jgi:MraZ protein